jgi:hypothetical protein
MGTGTASSLIAAAVVYWLIERNVGHVLIIGGAGIVVFILMLIFAKKPAADSAAPVHQRVKQEANPQISAQISPQFNPQFHNTIVLSPGDPDARTLERENARVDATVLERMKTEHPTQPYLIDELSKKLGIDMPDVRDSLKRLESRGGSNSAQARGSNRRKGLSSRRAPSPTSSTATEKAEHGHDVFNSRGSSEDHPGPIRAHS